MKSKFFVATCLAFVLLVSFPLAAFAAGNGSTDSISTTDDSKAIIQPQGVVVYEFDHYSESTHSINYKMKYVGTFRYDNRGNQHTTVPITFIASESGSWSASITIGSTVGAEVNAIVATVKAEVSISGTLTRTWTADRSYGVSLPVPPGKVGYIEAYMAGTSTKGTGYYRRYDTSFEDYTIVSWPLGGYVPALNYWNMVGTISNS